MPHALPHARRDDAGRLGSSARRRGMKRILLLALAPLAIPVPVTAQTMDHSNMPGMQMPAPKKPAAKPAPRRQPAAQPRQRRGEPPQPAPPPAPAADRQSVV